MREQFITASGLFRRTCSRVRIDLMLILNGSIELTNKIVHIKKLLTVCNINVWNRVCVITLY